MTLTDTGPIVAWLDEDDPYHIDTVAALDMLPSGGLLTTWPCLTESFHLLGKFAGRSAQEDLWGYVGDGTLTVHMPTHAELARCRQIMFQFDYCDFADASLVALAETSGLRRIFTLDRHFYAYRLADGSHLNVFPEPAR